MTQLTDKYSLKDVGCYIDGARGIYAIDAIVKLAETHGYKNSEKQDAPLVSMAHHELAGEIEDECDDYMNANYPVEGAYWGRSEQGDWGLWAIEEN